MIKSNELRIGNLVAFGYEYKGAPVWRPCKVLNLLHDAAIVEDKRLELNLPYGGSGLNPIPLTPEILEKAGFNDSGEAVGSNWYYRLINIPSNHMNPTYELNLFTTEDENKYGVNLEEQYFGYCKSLHQLQNLYFALTGEELPIEL